MSKEKKILAALTRPKSVIFPANLGAVEAIQTELPKLNQTESEGSVCWHEKDAPSLATTRVKVYPTGRMVFYNNEGRRFLCTDPQGTPLHEAEWGKDEDSNETVLLSARAQLDCKQWIGILPKARTFENQINIKDQPGWENMTLDFLREKAAEVWRVPLSEVKYFYRDQNLVPLGDGKYDVRLTKDGLYALPNKTFDQPIFISYMFSLNWARLETIPVVELFQSTLPGSGGAVFEFIWGLYEDQSREEKLGPLRYRGLPTYPSAAAFRIFSAFFTPSAPEGEEDILRLFMDTNRSHEILWSHKPNPPWRFFNEEHGVCVTVQDHFLYKVTVFDDPVSTPFINHAHGGKPSCQREVQVTVNSLILVDGELSRELPLAFEWRIAPNPTQAPVRPTFPFNWEWFFNGFPPEVDPVKSLYTVPFYPDGRSEIDESALQPLALDQILYYMEMSPVMPAKLEKLNKVLIHTFDMVTAGCVDCTREREYTVLFSDAELAQKNARQLWDYAVSRNQLDNLKKVSFMPEKDHLMDAYKEKYDMVFKWIPLMYYKDRIACEGIIKAVVDTLLPDGILFLAGPRPIKGLFEFYGLDCLYSDPVMNMPFFRQHLKMCPENLINEELTIFMAEKVIKKKETPPTPKIDEPIKIPDIPIRDFSRPN